MAENYYITLEIHDEGEWPRIAPENLMQHVDVHLPSGLTLAGAKVSEAVNSFDELVSALEKAVPRDHPSAWMIPDTDGEPEIEECFFCGQSEERKAGEPFKHDPTCAGLVARAVLAKVKEK